MNIELKAPCCLLIKINNQILIFFPYIHPHLKADNENVIFHLL